MDEKELYTLPHVFGSVLEAAAYADILRAHGEDRPMEALPIPDGRGVLKYYDKEIKPNDDQRADL